MVIRKMMMRRPCKESSESALLPLQTFLHRSNLLVLIIIIKMIITMMMMTMMTRPDYKEEREHYRTPLSLDRAPTGSRTVLPPNPRSPPAAIIAIDRCHHHHHSRSSSLIVTIIITTCKPKITTCNHRH